MVYKWGLGYFSYFCNANHIQRGNAAHKKSVTTRSKGILAPDRALWRIFVLVCDWRPTSRRVISSASEKSVRDMSAVLPFFTSFNMICPVCNSE